MASLVDRGDSRMVTYLGSCMLTTSSTGLGVLQKPLRELYFTYKLSSDHVTLTKQRYLTMSSRGMTMRWQEKSNNQPVEIFYSMPNILFWDAVQFVVVKGTKRLCGAFEPLDNDHSKNKDNLFSVLEKKYNFLQQMSHPPLFACVLRRTTGVKALDVHAFICSSDEEALGLIHGLNIIQNSYNDNQVSETGAFSYRPFFSSPGQDFSNPPISRPVVDDANVSVTGGVKPNIQVPASIKHMVARNAAEAAAAARLSAKESKSPPLSQEQKQPAKANVVSLVQDDFQPKVFAKQTQYTSQSEQNHLVAVGQGRPHASGRKEENPADHVYQYIRHIGDTVEATAENSSPSNAREFSSVDPQYGCDRKRSNSETNYNIPKVLPKEYQSMTRSMDLFEDTLNPTLLKPSQIVAKFEEKAKETEKAKATAAIRPQPVVSPRASKPIPVSKKPSSPDYSFLSESVFAKNDKAGTNYESVNPPYVNMGRENHSPGYDRKLPRDPELTKTTLVPTAFYANESDRNFTSSSNNSYSYGQPPTLPERSRPIVADARSPPKHPYSPVVPVPASRSHPSPFDRPRSFTDSNTSEAPARPVAKVTPHKISGVGIRVLPTNPVVPYHPSVNPSTNFTNADNQQREPRLPDKLYGVEQLPQIHNTRSPGLQPDNGSEWESQPVGKEEKNLQRPRESDRNMDEKLLLREKKDAEIASVMQNLHFEYDTSTVTPGVPAGNNFEKSLGYFP